MIKGGDFSYECVAIPPGALFVAANEPLLLFPSVSAAESSLEVIDVAAGVYQAAYGPNGEPHRVTCKGNRVRIERTGESHRPDELKPLLLRYLEACEDPGDATQPLDELVAIAWSIERDFWLRSDPSGDRSSAGFPIGGSVAVALTLGAIWYFAFR